MITNYPGSKGGSGVAEKIVSMMPPHDLYIEAFAGGAAVFRLKRPADQSILIDMDPRVVSALGDLHDPPAVNITCTDAVEWLGIAGLLVQHERTLVYADPPYLLETRTRPLYDYEMLSAEDHWRLLRVLTSLHCKVMISGYWSKLYADALAGWRVEHFQAGTRGGPREEFVWLNFSPPAALHDPRFFGKDFRERERIKRKRRRWASRFAAMPGGERQIIREALEQTEPPAAGGSRLLRATTGPAMLWRTAPPAATDPDQTPAAAQSDNRTDRAGPGLAPPADSAPPQSPPPAGESPADSAPLPSEK